jgi:hypothetical protein
VGSLFNPNANLQGSPTSHEQVISSLHPHTRLTIKKLAREELNFSATPNRVLLTGWETMEPSVYI